MLFTFCVILGTNLPIENFKIDLLNENCCIDNIGMPLWDSLEQKENVKRIPIQENITIANQEFC